LRFNISLKSEEVTNWLAMRPLSWPNAIKEESTHRVLSSVVK
jgi:hypothetical protein